MSHRDSHSNPLAAILGAAGVVAVFTLVSRVCGFARWLAQATWLGAGEVGNAYASANQIPNVIFEIVVGGALASLTVPLLSSAVAAKLRSQVNQTASALLTWTLTLLIPLAALIAIFAPVIAQLLPTSVGSDALSQNRMATEFLQIFAIQIPLYGVAVVLGGILQAHHRFAWPAVMPALSSAVTIGAYAVYDLLAIGADNPTDPAALLALGGGTSLGVVALSLPLFIPVTRLGLRLHLTWKLPPEQITQAVRLGGYGIGSLLAAQGYMLATLFLTRWGGEIGTINIFQYSQAIYLLPYALFTYPIATVVFPILTKQFANKQTNQAYRLATHSTSAITSLALLGIAGLYAVAPGLATIFAWNRPLVGLEVAIVSLCPALWGYALLYHLSRVLVALDAPRYSFWAALVGWSVSAVAAWLLILCLAPQRGDSLATLIALGIGNSLGMTLAGIILLMVWRSFDRSGVLLVIRSVAIMAPGAILAAFAGRLAYGGVSSLSLPAPALWSCLVAGLVVVGICLPGLHWSTLAFQQLVSSARHDETPAASSENTDSSGEENPGGGEA